MLSMLCLKPMSIGLTHEWKNKKTYLDKWKNLQKEWTMFIEYIGGRNKPEEMMNIQTMGIKPRKHIMKKNKCKSQRNEPQMGWDKY